MRVEPGIEGGIVVQGTPEEWARVRERLDEMVAELTNDVLPAEAAPSATPPVTAATASAASPRSVPRRESPPPSIRVIASNVVRSISISRPGRPPARVAPGPLL